jgi:hypothetical protein
MRKKLMIAILAGSVLMTAACGREAPSGIVKHQSDETSNSEDTTTGNAVTLSDGQSDGTNASETIEVKVSADINVTSSVPDPASADGEIVLSLYQEDLDAEEEEDEAEEAAREAAWKKQFLDFSFLGLKKRARVVNWQVAKITNSAVSNVSISYSGYQKERQSETKQGNCLVLSLGIYSDEAESDFSAMDSYLAVLDYRNHKSYLLQTDLISRYNDVISCYDLTGDDRDEIIYFNDPNKEICWEVFRFDGEKFSPIYGDTEDDGVFGDKFKIKLLNNYKLKIAADEFDFRETIPLKNLGIRKCDVEEIPEREISEDDWLSAYFRCYKNGKVTENISFVDSVLSDYRAYDDEEVWTCLTKGNAKDGLKIPLNICLTKWVTVGKAYAIVKYNAKTDRLEMVGADVEWRKLNPKKDIWDIV